jgi:hypothetical protein
MSSPCKNRRSSRRRRFGGSWSQRHNCLPDRGHVRSRYDRLLSSPKPRLPPRYRRSDDHRRTCISGCGAFPRRGVAPGCDGRRYPVSRSPSPYGHHPLTPRLVRRNRSQRRDRSRAADRAIRRANLSGSNHSWCRPGPSNVEISPWLGWPYHCRGRSEVAWRDPRLPPSPVE